MKRQEVKAGTAILLFPGEWHSYAPDSETGWEEYWIGFKGKDMDEKDSAIYKKLLRTNALIFHR